MPSSAALGSAMSGNGSAPLARNTGNGLGWRIVSSARRWRVLTDRNLEEMVEMAHDQPTRGGGNWRDEQQGRGGREGDRGYGRDPGDRDPGAHVDYYRGGDRGQQRFGPEGGFEMRDDYRRTERHADQGQAFGRGYGGGGHGQQRAGSRHDPHYAEWRRRQIEALDRDYHEYSTENASRFEAEFSSWREKRGQQRQAVGRATEHMEVVGSDDQHVGTVDKVEGDRIILTRSDPSAEGHHHSVPCGWIESVDDKVRLNRTADQAMQAWRDEETSRALFEDKDSGSEGPHILDRSFSGTYRDE
jgi:hypothetical protein